MVNAYYHILVAMIINRLRLQLVSHDVRMRASMKYHYEQMNKQFDYQLGDGGTLYLAPCTAIPALHCGSKLLLSAL